MRFVFVLVFSSLLSIAVASLGEERIDISAFRTFVRFVLVWLCLCSLPLDVREGLLLVIVDFSFIIFPLSLALSCLQAECTG